MLVVYEVGDFGYHHQMSKSGKRAQSSSQSTSTKQPPSNLRYISGSLFSLLRRHGSAFAGWGCIAYLGHQASLAFIAYAGKASSADLNLKILANLNVVFAASITVAGLSITLYIRERRLHRKSRERLGARVKELELKIDPKRTSSHLTPEGLTRKEDM